MLSRHGFVRTSRDGEGSGGPFAEATFARDERSVTLWLRRDSLSVIYRYGDYEVDHLAYMQEVAGVGGPNEFPTYSNDAIASFRALRRDLDRFGSDFLDGDSQRLVTAARQRTDLQQMTPMQRLAAIEAAAKQRR